MIFLDTHVVVWIYSSVEDKLSKTACELIDNSEAILISPMVLLEMDYLFEIGKIRGRARVVYGYLKRAMGLSICDRPFGKIIEFASTQSWTRDPFDRIIVSQAALGGNILVSKDEQILKHYVRAKW